MNTSHSYDTEMRGASQTPVEMRSDTLVRQARKSLTEQIDVMRAHLADTETPDVDFVRTHALAIVQLCDEIRYASGP